MKKRPAAGDPDRDTVPAASEVPAETRAPRLDAPAPAAPPAPAEPRPPAVQVAKRGVAIGGSATNTVISTGDGNIIAGTVLPETLPPSPAARPAPAVRPVPPVPPAIQIAARGEAMGDRAYSVFISYAHEDESLRTELDQHLSLLVREGRIRPWHNRKISAGDDWRGQIDQRLEAADVILLLVSASFLDSDYCFDVESTRALERHALGEARVIPVIVRPCDWRTAPFADLQPLPEGGRPVTRWRNRDEAWLDVTRGLRAMVDVLRVG